MRFGTQIQISLGKDLRLKNGTKSPHLFSDADFLFYPPNKSPPAAYWQQEDASQILGCVLCVSILYYITPWAIIARATFIKPATFAPFT